MSSDKNSIKLSVLIDEEKSDQPMEVIQQPLYPQYQQFSVPPPQAESQQPQKENQQPQNEQQSSESKQKQPHSWRYAVA